MVKAEVGTLLWRILEQNVGGDAWCEFMGGVGPEPRVTQAAKRTELLVVRWGAKESGVRGGEREAGRRKAGYEIGGGDEGVVSVREWDRCVGEKCQAGLDDIKVSALRHAFVFRCVRWGREMGDPVGGEE